MINQVSFWWLETGKFIGLPEAKSRGDRLSLSDREGMIFEYCIWWGSCSSYEGSGEFTYFMIRSYTLVWT